MRIVLAAILALSALPALASDLSPADIATIFCAARLTGDMSKVDDLLTPQLRTLIEGKSVSWSGIDLPPLQCQPMGSSGTFDNPVSVLFVTFADGTTTSDRLTLNYVDGNLRIDDVGFRGGESLRGRLR